MAEETKAETTQVTEAKATEPAGTQKQSGAFKPPLDASDILIEGSERDARTGDYPPLFGEEAVFSEAELGAEIPSEETKAEEKKTEEVKEPPAEAKKEEKPPGEEKAAPQPKEGEKPEEKKPEEKKPEDEEKPPPGHVPYAALHEERTKRKELADQVAALAMEVERLRTEGLRAEKEDADEEEADTVPSKKEFEDFKVLSDKELSELEKEDPEEAVSYLKTLRKYEKHQEAVSKREAQKREEKVREQMAVKASLDRLAKNIPELYTDNNKTARELTDFAVQHGFSQEALYMLTDPATKIYNPKVSKSRMPIGESAAVIVETIYKLRKASAINEKDMRDAIEKELRPKITEEIMAKFKKPEEGYRSIGDLPGSGEGNLSETFRGKLLTEKQLAKLSPAEQAAYLGAV